MNLQKIDTVISIALGAGGAMLGYWGHLAQVHKARALAIAEEKERHAETVKKEYASQRDFAHIQRNLEQLNQSLNLLIEDSDNRLDALEASVSELKGGIRAFEVMVKTLVSKD